MRMGGCVVVHRSQIISSCEGRLTNEQCRSRLVASNTPPPRELSGLSFRNISKSGRNGRISESWTDALSHVSVSSKISHEDEPIKLHNESRLGTTLRMLASRNDKGWRFGERGSQFGFNGGYKLSSTTWIETWSNGTFFHLWQAFHFATCISVFEPFQIRWGVSGQGACWEKDLEQPHILCLWISERKTGLALCL